MVKIIRVPSQNGLNHFLCRGMKERVKATQDNGAGNYTTSHEDLHAHQTPALSSMPIQKCAVKLFSVKGLN